MQEPAAIPPGGEPREGRAAADGVWHCNWPDWSRAARKLPRKRVGSGRWRLQATAGTTGRGLGGTFCPDRVLEPLRLGQPRSGAEAATGLGELHATFGLWCRCEPGTARGPGRKRRQAWADFLPRSGSRAAAAGTAALRHGSSDGLAGELHATFGLWCRCEPRTARGPGRKGRQEGCIKAADSAKLRQRRSRQRRLLWCHSRLQPGSTGPWPGSA
jgi:hypothetical protein